jgi:hypothetical protein
MPNSYDYTADQTRWTIRKVGDTYNVVRLDLNNEVVQTAAVGYSRAGAAATYAAQLAYRQAQEDDVARLRTYLIDGDAPPDTEE